VALDVLEVFKKYRLTPADIDAVLGFLRFYNTAGAIKESVQSEEE